MTRRPSPAPVSPAMFDEKMGRMGKINSEIGKIVMFTAIAITGACIPADPGLGGDAAVPGSGGRTTGLDAAASGSGGNTTGSGGQLGSGGQVGTGTGGSGSGAGGNTTGSGGAEVTGGSSGTGGTAGRGGTTSTGGAGTGGRGGTAGGRGGTTGTGGSATGGVATGGRGTGGSGTGGSGTGGSGTGGAAPGTGGTSGPTSCNLPNHTGSGSYTFYYFAQGTYKEGSGYRTACGYYGTQSGSSASGPNDMVTNVATMSPASAKYFAAIPGNNGFDSKGYCGACVQVTGQNGKSVIATVADECPYGSDGGNSVCGANAAGHLDLSTAAFDAIGPFTNSQGATIGNPTNTTWKFVPCPVTGNVVLQIKNGNDNEFFIQNTILAVKSVVRGGETAIHQKYGAWHFAAKLNAGDTLTLTDTLNRTLAIQVGNTTMGQNQDTGRQFPACQ